MADPPKVAPRRDKIHELAAAAGWLHPDSRRLGGEINYQAMAKGLPFDRSAVHRIMSGHSDPSPAFVVQVLRAARRTFPERPAEEPDYFTIQEESCAN